MKKYALIWIDESNDQINSSTNDKNLSVNKILEAVPKNIRNKVRTLLTHIKQNENYIQWNDKGEIIIDGETFPNSQIIDLIKCCFYPYKNFIPVGLQQFEAALGHINTPQTLIGAGLKRLQTFPPPGVPTKKRKEWIWHQI